ncbi:MAG: PsbP-related protein [Candidatus Pacebacteria bacterium]|nr:PsbP-related protein [Candidatus Paceibacterota bacterium]
MSRGFAPLAVAFVLALLIGGVVGYFLVKKDQKPLLLNSNKSQQNQNVSNTTMTSTQTAATSSMKASNEKTYQNAQFGFSFKYPSDWTVEENNNLTTLLFNTTFKKDGKIVMGINTPAPEVFYADSVSVITTRIPISDGSTIAKSIYGKRGTSEKDSIEITWDNLSHPNQPSRMGMSYSLENEKIFDAIVSTLRFVK